MSLKGQTALVIGGASGIGLASAKELLRAGAQVTVSDISASGEAVVKELQAEFGPKRSLFIKADVCDDEQMEAAFSTTKKHFKRLDIMINSAGICNDSNWDKEVDINLKGVIRGTLLAWNHMGKHKGGAGGTVVNMVSTASMMIMKSVPVYNATKFGVLGFSRCCGVPYHFDRTGVRVLSICPGYTNTGIVNNLGYLSEDLAEQMDAIRATLPLQTAANVGKGVLQLILNAKSGSVWVCEDEKPVWEVAFPAYSEMRANPKGDF